MKDTAKSYSEIRWGIIGCGNVTEVKSGPAFNKITNSRLHAVMRRDFVKANDYAQRHGVPVAYGDADVLIKDPDVNAVYIATPPQYHESYTIAALEQGKNVYVEKPVALNTKSCQKMIDAVKANDAKLSIAHYRRALPMFKKVKQLVEGGAIGKIKMIRLNFLQPHDTNIVAQTDFNWRLVPEYSGGGIFYDLAPHQLDILVYIFGTPKAFSGIAVNHARIYNAEDTVSGTILFEENILFQGNWCFTTPKETREDTCQLIGELGMLEFPFFATGIKTHIEGVERHFPFVHPEHIQQPMIQEVVNYFLGNGNNPCSVEDALQSLRIMEEFVYGGDPVLSKFSTRS
jgi:predicted dehydrogenase